jgi:hypothetical protein
MQDAAHAERILSFILGAVGDFVVERAKAFVAMSLRIRAHVRCRKPENLSERMLGCGLICHY